jgi:hypothetical protein
MRNYLIHLNQTRSKQSLQRNSISSGKRSGSNSNSSNSQPIKEIGGEWEVNIEGNDGTGDLDVLEWSGDGRVLRVYELYAESGPVVACEGGASAEWCIGGEAVELEGCDVEVEG